MVSKLVTLNIATRLNYGFYSNQGMVQNPSRAETSTTARSSASADNPSKPRLYGAHGILNCFPFSSLFLVCGRPAAKFNVVHRYNVDTDEWVESEAPFVTGGCPSHQFVVLN